MEPANPDFKMEYAVFLANQADWRAAQREAEYAFAIDIGQAARWLEQALNGDPNSIALHYIRALLRAFQGHYLDARLVYEQRLRESTRHPHVAANLAQVCTALADWDAGEEYYRAALHGEPNNVLWLSEYANVLEQCGRDREALGILERAVELAPEDRVLQTRTHAFKARTDRAIEARKYAALAKLKLEEDGDLVEAEELARQALTIAPECALAHYVQSQILRRGGSLFQAETALRRAYELEPANEEFQRALESLNAEIEPRKRLAADLVARARMESDVLVQRECLEHANALAESVEAHLAFVELELCDDPAQAEAHLRAALTLAPHHFAVNRRYALWLSQQGRAPQAEQFFNAALTINPQDEELVDQYARWLFAQERYHEAQTYLDSALGAHPDNPRLQVLRLIAAARLDPASPVLPQFEQLIQANPEDVLVMREYAVALRHNRQPGRAEDYMQQAIRLNPDDVIARREYAALLASRQLYHKAFIQIQSAVLGAPDDPRVVAQAEEIRERQTRFERAEAELAFAVYLAQQLDTLNAARDAFENALAKDQTSWLILQEFAAFLERQGDYTRAAELLQRALNVALENSDDAQQLQARLERVRTQIPSPLPPLPPVPDQNLGLPPLAFPNQNPDNISVPPPPLPVPQQPAMIQRLKKFFGIK
jgi:tetratricopeptide (TPR) repeat protein